MKRGLPIYAALAVLCALLAGCDKCTDGLQELRLPQLPKSCSDRAPR
jgi:hypothetical protein